MEILKPGIKQELMSLDDKRYLPAVIKTNEEKLLDACMDNLNRALQKAYNENACTLKYHNMIATKKSFDELYLLCRAPGNTQKSLCLAFKEAGLIKPKEDGEGCN